MDKDVECVCVCVCVCIHTHTHTHTMEYYSAMKRDKIGSFVEMWMNLESVIQSEVSQKEKNKYRILTHTCGIYKNGTDEPTSRAGTEMQM